MLTWSGNWFGWCRGTMFAWKVRDPWFKAQSMPTFFSLKIEFEVLIFLLFEIV